MKGSASILARAKTFIYENGRLLDRRRFEYFFEHGSKVAVLSSLRAYQNEDGGFGNALEPDIRCPQSQPIPTEMALLIMDEIHRFDPSIIEGISNYLKKITRKTGGFPLAFRSLNDYPHAPWWTTHDDSKANINPTGSIMGLLMKQTAYTKIHQEEWFQQTLDYIWDYFEREKPVGFHDGIQWTTFLTCSKDSRTTSYLSHLDQWLHRSGAIERNPNAEGYVHKVLDWAPARTSYATKFITEAELTMHLDHLLHEQQDDGGWPINFPAVSQLGELEWRGWVTVERLKTLKSYGWL